jgi:hypothetical protein
MFNNTSRAWVVAFAVAAAALTGPVAAQTQPAKQKLVIQVSDADPGKWRLALNNV